MKEIQTRNMDKTQLEDPADKKIIQLDLFSTGITCSYCMQDPGRDPQNGNVWNGFWDMDIQQYVCWKCRDIHYRSKWNTEFAKLWSEFPVMVNHQTF